MKIEYYLPGLDEGPEDMREVLKCVERRFEKTKDMSSLAEDIIETDADSGEIEPPGYDEALYHNVIILIDGDVVGEYRVRGINSTIYVAERVE